MREGERRKGREKGGGEKGGRGKGEKGVLPLFVQVYALDVVTNLLHSR